MKLQQKAVTPDRPLLPVGIMVPVDLRRHFSSGSLRNFSLYALPKLRPEDAALPFQEASENMAAQLRAQTTVERGRMPGTACRMRRAVVCWCKSNNGCPAECAGERSIP